MFKYKFLSVILFATILLSLGGCASNHLSVASVENALIEDMTARINSGQLELDTIHFGSFSSGNSKEAAVVFHSMVDETDPSQPELTCLGIYNTETLTLVAYMYDYNDQGSSTDFHFLSTQKGQTYILALTGGAAQGVLYSYPQLLTVEDGELVENHIPGIEQGTSNLVIATAHMGQPFLLTILKDDGEFRTIKEYPDLFSNVVATLSWSSEKCSFIPIDEA